MKRFSWVVAALLALGCGAGEREAGSEGAFEGSARPDLILHGAAIYTVAEPAWAQAIAVRDDEIVAVGTDETVLDLAGPDTLVIDVEGAMILPGLQDPHLHAVEAGLNREVCFLEPGLSLSDYGLEMRACARDQPKAPWVRAAVPFIDDLLDSEELPIDILDRAIPGRPALVLDAVGHAVWCNSKALEIIGIDESSKDPAGGILHRDPGTGRLTGLLLEAAQYLAHDAAEPPTAENLDRAYEALLDSLDRLNRQGITTVSDAGGYWPRGHHKVWARAEREETLSVRASNAFFVYPYRDIDEQLRELRALFSSEADRLVRFDQAKIYVDGIPSLGSAALLEPYVGTDDRGLLYFSPEDLARYGRELQEIGFGLHLHATGDRGVRLGLDMLETIDASGHASDDAVRHRITHLYFVDPQDLPRFAQLGTVADFQIGPESSSQDYEGFIAEQVGDRARRVLPMGELIAAHAHVMLSSDWDAEPLAPFESLQRGLQRHRDAIPDLAAGLRMMTLDVAVALGHGGTTGSLEVGKKADVIVIDRNLFEMSPAGIGETSVLLTLLGGEVVFAAPGWELDE